MLSIQTNVTALLNGNNIFKESKTVEDIGEKLSSGLKINRGADDPSGLAISMGMKARYRGISEAIQGMQEFLSYLEARDKCMGEQASMAQRMRDLAVQAANEATLTSSQLTAMDNEVKKLASTIDTIGKTSALTGYGDTPECRLLFGPGELDVVWVMDQTGSMGLHLGALANTAAQQMFDSLTAKKFDLRMAAVGFGVDVPPAANDVTHDPDPVTDPRNGLPGIGDVETLGTINALSDAGEGRQFRTTAAQFKGDVLSIADSSGGTERGIDATYQSAQLFGLAPSASATPLQFRQDAQKVFMVITDERSCDNGNSF